METTTTGKLFLAAFLQRFDTTARAKHRGYLPFETKVHCMPQNLFKSACIEPTARQVLQASEPLSRNTKGPPKRESLVVLELGCDANWQKIHEKKPSLSTGLL
ncbi:TPA: hypothetical protein ACNU27_004071, partial [Aeromonas salmonicida subsp. salmonicida]